MDKTFNDLMDIVNRTKKIDGKDSPRPPRVRPQRVIEEEPMDEEYTPREYDIDDKQLKKSKASTIGEDSAIGKLLDKKTKKTTTKKSSSAKPSKKAPAKTTKKSTPKKKEDKVEEKKAPVKKTPVPKPQPTLSTPNYDDPRNVQLYEALQNSLLRGGTDISEYMTSDSLSDTQNSLQEIRAKREAQKINAEISKEQQEYEQLFNGSLGSFMGNEEETTEEVEETTDNNTIDVAKKNIELANDLSKIKADIESKKKPTSLNSVARDEKNSHDSTFELETGNKDLDRKIAEYYRRKQEKINEYKAQEESFEEVKKEDDNKPVDYESIFGGTMTTRAELMGEPIPESATEPEETIETTEPVEQIESTTEEEITEPEEVADESEENTKENVENTTSSLETDSTTEETTEKEEIENTEGKKDENIKNILSDLLFSKKAHEEEKSEADENKESNEHTEENEKMTAEEYAKIWGGTLSEDDTHNKESDNETDSDTDTSTPEQTEVPTTESIEDTEPKVVEGESFVMTDAPEEPKEITEYIDRTPTVVEDTTEEISDSESEEIQQEETQETTTEDAESTTEETTETEEVVEDKKPITYSTIDESDDDDDFVLKFNTSNKTEETNKVEDSTIEDDKQEETTETENQTEIEDTVEAEEETTTEEIEDTTEDTTSEDLANTEADETEEVTEETENNSNEIITEENAVESEETQEDTLENNVTETESETITDEETNITDAESVKTEDNFIDEPVTEEISDVTSDENLDDYIISTNTNEEIDKNNDDISSTDAIEDINTSSEETKEIQTETTDTNEEYESFENSQDEVMEEISAQEDIAEDQTSIEDTNNLDNASNINDYIVDSNTTSPILNDEDNTLVMNTLPENKWDIFGNEIKKENETTTNESNSDTISRNEFYNEMARLQENLINELKGKKVETESKDFFAEEKEVSVNDQDFVNSIADQIIEKLTDEGVEDETPIEEEVIEEETPKTEEEIRLENLYSSDVGTKADPIAPELFDAFNLLGKEIALNEEDLEYQEKVNTDEEEETSEPKENYFYGSKEDNEKKANVIDEYMSIYNDEPSQAKEVGDINFFKNIGNAVPSSSILNEKEYVEPSNEEIEAIYTFMGLEKKPAPKPENDIKVLYVASECQPFVASGGLGDVAGSLPKAIAEAGGIDIRVILPLYGNIKQVYRDKFEYLGNFTVHLSWRQEYCGLFRYFKDGVTYYFIDNERYFKRDKLYGYYDDGERYAYFSKAIVEALPYLNFFPDIIHCNDWQSSLVSAYIKTGNWSDFRYYKIKNVYTIHNVEYQGVYGMENLKDLFGINPRFRNEMEYNGDINLTKSAIQYCDKLTTVSHSYCDNLKQPYCSRGLHHIIIRNEYKLSGIINGIDYDFYNPATDTALFKNYDFGCMEEKVLNKKLWQDEMGLPVDGDTPMLAIVSRLVSHKGLDLVSKVIENILQQDIQLVVVGTGDQRFVDFYKYLENKYPTKVRAFVDSYSNELARKAYAASDIFIMPSKIEPCGISQMIASRYGSVPIVREVGGLKDTITDFGCEGGGNGYTFTNYNPNDLAYQINRAIRDYGNKSEWKEKMKICMSHDFTWKKPAQDYINLYKSLI